ncbi:hypothetical protein V6N13_148195 [Hibiscus sabdariffa]
MTPSHVYINPPLCHPITACLNFLCLHILHLPLFSNHILLEKSTKSLHQQNGGIEDETIFRHGGRFDGRFGNPKRRSSRCPGPQPYLGRHHICAAGVCFPCCSCLWSPLLKWLEFVGIVVTCFV